MASAGHGRWRSAVRAAASPLGCWARRGLRQQEGKRRGREPGGNAADVTVRRARRRKRLLWWEPCVATPRTPGSVRMRVPALRIRQMCPDCGSADLQAERSSGTQLRTRCQGFLSPSSNSKVCWILTIGAQIRELW
ncbi:uncharacterized protein LOC115349839 isoform X2 [Aquila chrysaetos chrysaetos]|uniref:uncharacterized protein LOC115349839 isoform X2 n=1 Tax=Aquila chrysaetos chrysaetos TaxID=223781 RepID=UPI001B7D4409|nr:uncharacterized protein LOC115349839 isoform X2 [Aquila chrysaetos chrysaetos]